MTRFIMKLHLVLLLDGHGGFVGPTG